MSGRVLRILLPFFVWSGICLALRNIALPFLGGSADIFGPPLHWSGVVRGLLLGDTIYPVLWFLPALAGVTVLGTLLRRRQVAFAAFAGLGMFVAAWWDTPPWPSNLHFLGSWSMGLFMYLLGVLLARRSLSVRACGLALPVMLLLSGGSYVLDRRSGFTPSTVTWLLAFAVAVALFGVMRAHPDFSLPFAGTAMGVYVFHLTMLRVVWVAGVGTSWALACGIALVCSVGISQAFARVRVLRPLVT